MMFMNCKTVLDSLYEKEREENFLFRLRRMLHIMVCPACAAEERTLSLAENLMINEFMPAAPDITGLVMDAIRKEKHIEAAEAPEVFSVRGWIIAGFFILISLTSAFFGGNFLNIANAGRLSFLLPIGITTGVIITAYGAMFIGTHLEMLCKKFGLNENS